MEDEQGHSRTLQIPSSSGDAGASSSSSLPPSHFHQDTDATATEVQVQLHPPDDVTADLRDHRRRSSRRNSPPRNESYRFNFTISNILPRDGVGDVWSCLAVLVTFWFFAASMTLILGFYGSLSLQLGPNCSQLITTNELFVQSIKAQQTEGSSGPMLYGFHTSPALDVETTWSETHNASVQTDIHNEWMYYLNAGSMVEISYDVKNSSSSLSLVIAQGEESLIDWIDDPSYPNTTLSWNTVYGSGTIEQEITSSDTYYVAVGNLNSNTIEVQLNLTIKALLYNTTQANYKCSLYNQVCSFSLILLKKNAVVITSPGPEQVKDDQDLYINLSYGPRWLSYIIGSVVLTIVVLLLFRFCSMFQPSQGDLSGTQTRARADNQEPLLSPKDDDISSWGSSYDSVSNDEEDIDELLQEQGKQVHEGENSANPKKLCVICFDSPRDCFFLPCGHCAACFTCGSRIAEEAGTCPICRRRMKKVRKIFSV